MVELSEGRWLRSARLSCVVCLGFYTALNIACATLPGRERFMAGGSIEFLVPEGPCLMGETGQPTCSWTRSTGSLGSPAWVEAVGPRGLRRLEPEREYRYNEGTLVLERHAWCRSWWFVVSFGPDKTAVYMRGRPCEEKDQTVESLAIKVGGPDTAVVAQPYLEERLCPGSGAATVTLEVREFGSGLGGRPLSRYPVFALRLDGTSWPLGETDENGSLTLSARSLREKGFAYVYIDHVALPVRKLADDLSRCFHQVVLVFPIPFF